MRRVSASITPWSAPTIGVRSVLLITSRSEHVIPGPPFHRIFLAAGDVDDVDDVDGEVGELGAEGGGEVVAAGIDQQQLKAGKAAGLKDVDL